MIAGRGAEWTHAGLLGADRELTLAEIAELTHAKLVGGENSDRRIRNIAPLDTAGACDISFLDHPRHLSDLADTRAGACLTTSPFAAAAPGSLAMLVTEEPYRAFVAVTRALFGEQLRATSLFGESSRAASVHVHVSARIESGVAIDPLALIGPRAQVGTGTVIGPGAVIGADVCLGRGCAVGAGATILHALIGDRVIIYPGARLGQSGIGRRADRLGDRRLPQIRRVILQDDAEIGANAAIERGSIRDTVVGEGTKIGNLVGVAQSVRIGRHCLIGAQTGIAGGATIGDFVIMEGQIAIAEDLTIGSGAELAGCSMIDSDVAAGAHLRGSPTPHGGRK